MTNRFGTFERQSAPWKEDGPVDYGVIDSETGKEYYTIGPKTSENLAALLNQRMADRKADFMAGVRSTENWLVTSDEAFEKYIGK